MKKSKLTIKTIKGKIPKDCFDCSRHDGIGLASNSYAIYCQSAGKVYRLLTSGNSKVITILRKHYSVEYTQPFWLHYNEYLISNK